MLTEWHDGKSGYLSQSVLPLYFGLDQATAVDRVEVDWPSGKKQVVTEGLRANSDDQDHGAAIGLRRRAKALRYDSLHIHCNSRLTPRPGSAGL